LNIPKTFILKGFFSVIWMLLCCFFLWKNTGLLSDTELAEDVAQDLVAGDLAGDLTQVEHAFTDVL